jgi:hypothetical protein
LAPRSSSDPLSARCSAAQKELHPFMDSHTVSELRRVLLEGKSQGLQTFHVVILGLPKDLPQSHRKEAIPLAFSLSSVIIGLLIYLCSHISFYTLQLSFTMSNPTNYNLNQRSIYPSHQGSVPSQHSHNSAQQNPSLGLQSQHWEDPEYLDFLYRYVKPRLSE